MGTLLVDLPYVAAVSMWTVSIARCRMVCGRHTRVPWLAMATLAAAQLLQINAGYRMFEAATGIVGSAAVAKARFGLDQRGVCRYRRNRSACAGRWRGNLASSAPHVDCANGRDDHERRALAR